MRQHCVFPIVTQPGTTEAAEEEFALFEPAKGGQVTGAFSFAASLLVRFLCTRNNWHKGKKKMNCSNDEHEHENTLKTFSPDR